MTTTWMKTSNGVEIRGDLDVFTYDYKWGKVDPVDFARVMKRNAETKWELSSNDYWFNVVYPDGSKGLFNGERMTTVCPACYRKYAECHLNKTPEDMPITDRRSAEAYIDAVYERQNKTFEDPGEIGPGIHRDTPSN
jgi:hypothetical protein